MTIDLSTLKKDDTVKFRDGGEAVVEDADIRCGLIHITFKGYYKSVCYLFRNKGRVGNNGELLLDIIEIIPAPINWDDVKPGNRFIHDRGHIITYIGEPLYNYKDIGYGVFSENSLGDTYKLYKKKELSPFYDLTEEVK